MEVWYDHWDTPIQETPRVKTHDPKTYIGRRDARDLNRFLQLLEQYFEAIGLEEEEAKVHSVVMFLTDIAMLWWYRRYVDMEWNTCTIHTWDDFKKEIKQIYPENVEYMAHKSLKQLKHMSYVTMWRSS